ncbi:hypothetical protein LILAB_00225 [Corallococcus macrosporus]|uniref:Uncharacterized protein n=1 Tax=Myxococcus fulvus (strain ATCC BAA-855 / HW-1) TaxID=483219 RepID=F8C8D5_MYXFH|nr:hypothetical protein LILAB_00225 [Corallococcus macrosporus]
MRAALRGEVVTVYVLESAASLGDPSFYPLLLALRDSAAPADNDFQHVLDDVIAQFEQSAQA